MAGPGDSGFRVVGSTGCLIGRMLILGGAFGVDGPEDAATELLEGGRGGKMGILGILLFSASAGFETTDWLGGVGGFFGKDILSFRGGDFSVFLDLALLKKKS